MFSSLARSPMRRLAARAASVAAGAAMIAALSLTATTAHAAEEDAVPAYAGQTSVGPLTIEPSSGNWGDPFTRVSTNGLSLPEDGSVRWYLRAVKGVLSDFNNRSATFAGKVATPTATSYDLGPADLLPAKAMGVSSTYLPGGLDKTVVGSTFAVILYGTTSATFITGSYFRADIVVTDLGENKTGWKVVTAAPVEAITPSIALAATAQTDGSVKLDATVKTTDGSTATDANGTVEFARAGGTTTSVPVSNGSATFTASGLEANTEYTYTATYRAGTADKYKDSGAATAIISTVGTPQAPVNTDVTVTIPASASGLKFTVAAGSVSLGNAAQTATAFTASGALPKLSVTDGRTTKSAWSLNGKSSALTNSADATKTIAAQYLGWVAPTVTGGITAGTAVSDLTTDRALASWNGTSTSNVSATIDTTVTLAAPTTTVAGEYKGILTLTLI
ncbi:hypothetical protein B0I08_10595 [Glaciihabitans tibetensis]|uniref:Ig-like domain-containing protein n=1 Tax=Glaciihabitans tibetensis TaxID=1266600 RepID=A0A2T0VCT3_9MICO|nr:hypothetical protein [Glaciihabitans tibetensis]PRY67934.1 hypothetical protein B0I08_10595 [Glaciihabitans tibetensis]